MVIATQENAYTEDQNNCDVFVLSGDFANYGGNAMKPTLILESVIWAFVFILVVPILGSSILMINTNPASTLLLLYVIATVYYLRQRRLQRPSD